MMFEINFNMDETVMYDFSIIAWKVHFVKINDITLFFQILGEFLRRE